MPGLHVFDLRRDRPLLPTSGVGHTPTDDLAPFMDTEASMDDPY
jgi:hypothetical protein